MTAPEEPNVDPSTSSGQVELAQRLQAALGEGYVVEKPLGAGGFAVVYLVKDLSLKRHLAVKVLSPDLITSKTVLERFRREAETVAQLSHPNIVPLHFIGQKDDLLYLAMACIDGGSVADRLEKEGPLPIADVERIITEVASALAHAHKRGVIHRDIKPQNVLTDAESGRSLVTDFGIARTGDSSLTATGMFVGTPTYLAPELVTGEPSDHRADIYALGVMGYEILGGKPPFDGPTPTAILMKRLAGPPEPIGSVRKDTPTELQAVIDACLASDPEHRFQSAGDIVAALGGDRTRTPTAPSGRTIPRPKPKKSWRTAVAIGVVVAVAAAVILAVVLKKAPSSSTPRPAGGGGTAGVLVDIPAGSYTIGAKNGKASDAPPYQVTLPAFAIEKTEVTVAAYKEFVGATGASPPWGDSLSLPTPTTLPVTRVIWQEAKNYCEWKYPAAGRLPTEEEWEAAARGQSSHKYPWGDTITAGQANTASAGRPGPDPVGSYPRSATALGAQDMIGNVWEWTSTPMQPYKGGAPLNAEQTKDTRVIRGGAFNAPDSIATVTHRGYNYTTTDRKYLASTGFRCARSLPVK